MRMNAHRSLPLSAWIVTVLATSCAPSPRPARHPQDHLVSATSTAQGDNAAGEHHDDTSTLPLLTTASPLDAVTPNNGADWYNATPLLVGLRTSERENAVKKAHFNQLPLYDLRVNLAPSSGVFDVNETLYYRFREHGNLSRLMLRVQGNTPGKAKRVVLQAGSCGPRTCTVRQRGDANIEVKLGDPLKTGEAIRVHLTLQGLLGKARNESVGLMAQAMASLRTLSSKGKTEPNYGLMTTWRGVASLSGFFAVLAPRHQGRWSRHETGSVGDFTSDDLANVRAQWLVPVGTKVMCPGWPVETLMVRDKQAKHVFHRIEVAAPMVRDFSAFVGADLVVTTTKVGDVLVRTGVTSESAGAAQKVQDTASRALTLFQERFGTYPYRRLDVAEAPLTGGAGGMEFSGLVAIAHMLIAPGDGGGPLAEALGGGDGAGSVLGGTSGGMDIGGRIQKTFAQNLEFTVAHEVAHQWWHGIVGSDSRRHPFVDEGLAQYSTLIYFEDRYGKKRAKQVADALIRSGYVTMRLLGGKDGAVDREAGKFTQLTYAGLVYGKGPYFYVRARTLLGDDRFFRGLRTYEQRHWFRMAPGTGPLQAFEDIAGGHDRTRLNQLATRWLRQAHGDKDLGPISASAMLESVLGPEGKKMAPVLDQLFGGGALGGSGGGKPAGAGKTTPKDAQRVLKQLGEMLDGI